MRVSLVYMNDCTHTLNSKDITLAMGYPVLNVNDCTYTLNSKDITFLLLCSLVSCSR